MSTNNDLTNDNSRMSDIMESHQFSDSAEFDDSIQRREGATLRVSEGANGGTQSATNNPFYGILNLKNAAGHTPFMLAVINGFVELATFLLKDEMSDPNYKDDKGDTPLHWAVLLKNSLLVKFLLNNGADLTIKNNNGNNPIMIACIN